MLSYRLGTANDFHWELKPVLSNIKYYYKNQIVQTLACDSDTIKIYLIYIIKSAESV